MFHVKYRVFLHGRLAYAACLHGVACGMQSRYMLRCLSREVRLSDDAMVRVPRDLYALLQRQAALECRSVRWQLVSILRDALVEWRGDEPGKAVGAKAAGDITSQG